MTIYGPGATGSDTDSNREWSDDPEPIIEHWYAVIRGLKVGVCVGWYVTFCGVCF